MKMNLSSNHRLSLDQTEVELILHRGGKTLVAAHGNHLQ